MNIKHEEEPNMEIRLNIYQRINEVRKEVEYIRKDALVQGYAAVSHDMVTAKLRDSLIKHGIVIIPNSVSRNVVETTTANNKHKIRFEAVYDVVFVNIDNPEDKFSITVDAHADDFGDKAPGKGLSYATKSVMLKIFSLETGESDESRMEDDRRGYTDAQKQGFDDLIAGNDALGVYLLTQQTEDNVYTSLFNSGLKGEKTKLKQLCRDMESTGREMAENIEKALEQSDAALAQENAVGLTHVGQALLRRHLGREGQDNLDQLLRDS